jgi:8-oxo-dGTP pyrophosphatase MutT (NUDIX family)
LTFRKLSERLIYQGKIIRVITARFAGPDGDEFERDIVRHLGAVAVVPVEFDDGGAGPVAVLVRQYRAPLEQTILEIPAGIRDVDGEPPERTARRELAEEVGLRAGRIEKLCEFQNSPGFSDERVWVYLALDLEECATSAQSVEEQHMTVERIALDNVPEMIATGAIVDAKTIIGLCLAREALS